MAKIPPWGGGGAGSTAIPRSIGTEKAVTLSEPCIQLNIQVYVVNTGFDCGIS